MKAFKVKFLIAAGMMAASFFVSTDSFAQARKLPDGTILYPDGSKRLPDGTVINKDGRAVGENNRTVSLPDGSVVLPDGTRTYPDDRRTDRNERKRYGKRDGRGLPPGQAKKIYGGNAKDYAPGQQKKMNNHKNNKEWKKNKG